MSKRILVFGQARMDDLRCLMARRRAFHDTKVETTSNLERY